MHPIFSTRLAVNGMIFANAPSSSLVARISIPPVLSVIALFLPIVESLTHSDSPLDWVTIYLIATYLFM